VLGQVDSQNLNTLGASDFREGFRLFFIPAFPVDEQPDPVRIFTIQDGGDIVNIK
jgi:hypothetical protein